MNINIQKSKLLLVLFIAGAIALFLMAVFIIGKQKNKLNSVTELNVTYYKESGLMICHNFLFSCNNKGIFFSSSINNDSRVRVNKLRKQDVKFYINPDSEVTFNTDGMIGDRLLILKQGSTNVEIVADGVELFSIEALETEAIMANLELKAVNACVCAYLNAENMTKVYITNFLTGLMIFGWDFFENPESGNCQS